MRDSTVGHAPAMKAVWPEQLRVVGLAIRREGALAGTILGLGCIVVVAMLRVPALSALVDGDFTVADLRIDPAEQPWGLFAVLMALLFPLLVWRGERPFGDTPLWSLPVDHRRHALTKVAAGWVWLVALLGAATLCLVLTALVSGGSVGAEEVRLVIIDRVGAAGGTAGALEEVRWSTQWWEWVLPFTAATAAYLLASSLVLGTAHPLRWAVVAWLLIGAFGVVAELTEVGWVTRGIGLVDWFIGGESLTETVTLPAGGRARAWAVLPSVGLWAASAALWVGLGLVGVLGASARPRDH